jgi:hypothetical protein
MSTVAREPRGLQDTIESSRVGRALISAFVFFTVAALVLWNLPESELRNRALPIIDPYIRATGLDQNWGVFAPDPRRETVWLLARVEYADGRRETLEFPTGNAIIGGYWDYRWRKYYEAAIRDERSGLWHPTAVWFARTAAEDGGEVATVTLVRRTQALLPPGSTNGRTVPREEAYYTLTVEPPSDSP